MVKILLKTLGALVIYWLIVSSRISEKVKVTLGMHMAKCGCDILGPGTLKSALSKE